MGATPIGANMRLTSLLAAALTFVLAIPALAQLEKGDKPRPLGGDARFLNAEDVDLVKLRSKVVVLQLAHTSSDPCKEQVAKLKEMREKHGEAGLRIVVVFEEPLEAVEAWVKEQQADYPVVAGVGDLRTRWGLVKGFPTTYVLDVEGNVAWAGNFADRAEIQIAELLKKVTDRPWIPAAYEEIGAHIDGERFGEAREGLVAALGVEKVPDDDRGRLEALLAWVDALAEKAFAEADAVREEDVYKGWKALQAMAEKYPGYPAAEKAQEAVDALMADKTSKREIDAWLFYEEQFEAAKEVETTDKKKAIRLLQKVVTKFRGTAAADKAKYWVDRLKQ
jgi:thiol-disulfide isomerase/thioredoxin